MDTPFLSVVVRTDGSHPATFDDLLLALAGQSVEDYEVIIVVTGNHPDAMSRLRVGVEEYEPAFGARVQIVGPPESTVLLTPAQAGNVGLGLSRGRYVALLGDDSVPFGHWAPSLMAAADSGAVLRVGVATQLIAAKPGYWRRAGEVNGTAASLVDAYDMVAEPRTTEHAELGLLDLMLMPTEPLSAYAFPRSILLDGEGFDEELPPQLADWDFLLRSVGRCGVTTIGVLGLLQRVWGEEPLVGDVSPVLAKLDAQAVRLGPGGAGRIIESLRATPDVVTPDKSALQQLQAQVDSLGAAYADAEARLEAVHRSTSWKITAPLRAVIRRVRPGR